MPPVAHSPGLEVDGASNDKGVVGITLGATGPDSASGSSWCLGIAIRRSISTTGSSPAQRQGRGAGRSPRAARRLKDAQSVTVPRCVDSIAASLGAASNADLQRLVGPARPAPRASTRSGAAASAAIRTPASGMSSAGCRTSSHWISVGNTPAPGRAPSSGGDAPAEPPRDIACTGPDRSDPARRAA